MTVAIRKKAGTRFRLWVSHDLVQDVLQRFAEGDLWGIAQFGV